MYAVIEAAGFQYKIREGDRLVVPRLKAKEGDEVHFEKVLLLAGDEGVQVGQPYVPGVRVIARVARHFKLPKVIVFKYKKRKNYRRKKGHRQPVTEVVVERIERS